MEITQVDTSKLITIAAPDINTLIADPNVLKLYANAFAIGFSLSDVTISFQQGATPVAVLSISYASLKSLQASVNQFVSVLENSLGEPIKSSEDIREMIMSTAAKKQKG